MHDAPADVLSGSYPEDEYWQDLLKVTGGQTNERLARMTIRHTGDVPRWMIRHGARFQPPLGGTLHLARTNAFFLGGGKALINAYYRAAEALGVEVAYDAEVIEHRHPGRQVHLGDRGAPGSAARDSREDRGGGRGRIRVEPRLAARSVGPGGRQLPRARHAIQHGAGVAHASRQRRASPSAMRPRVIASRSTPARRSSTAASARASTACRSASWSTGMRSASTTRASISGPSATRSGAGSSPRSPIRSPTRSSTPRRCGKFIPPMYPPIKADSMRELARRSSSIPPRSKRR